MNDFPWLTAVMLLPLLGAAMVVLTPSAQGAALPKQVALLFSGATLLLTAVVAFGHYENGRGMQLTETHEWISAFGANYALGVDGLGLTLVLLTALLVPFVVLAGWNDADNPDGSSTRSYFALMLALEGLALGVFMAQDVFLFYVFFEATLIPAYFLIGRFGPGADRARAAIKFLLFMLAGGLIMLASVVGLYAVSAEAGTPSYLISDLAQLDISQSAGRWLFLGFFVAFAIKAPMFPVHTWLPDTTQAATPATSVLLICVLDKIGTYGMIRFCLGLFPEASEWATPVVIVMALISIVYGAIVAMGADNLLRFVGLTSLSHFGFIVLGIFVMNRQGLSGSTLYMFNHGISTALLFIVVGYLIHRRGTASIRELGGIEKAAPVLAGLLLIGALGTLGLPGLSPFVSEFLVLLGAFRENPVYGVIAVTGIVLAAVYALRVYQRTMTGPREVPEMADLSPREVGAVAPLVLALVLFGFYPQPLLDVINPMTSTVMDQLGQPLEQPEVSPDDVQHEPEGGMSDGLREAHA